jgi:hypothetical protein
MLVRLPLPLMVVVMAVAVVDLVVLTVQSVVGAVAAEVKQTSPIRQEEIRVEPLWGVTLLMMMKAVALMKTILYHLR